MLVIVGLAGCGADDAAGPQITTHNGTQAVADALHGPGTALGDGFEVPQGAALVGAVLPNPTLVNRSSVEDPGLHARRAWTAVLVMDGAADAVYRDLMRQAAQRGLSSRGVFGSACSATGASTGVQCGGGAVSSDGAVLEAGSDFAMPKRSLTIEAKQGVCDDCPAGAWPSLAIVTYAELDDHVVTSPTTVPPTDVTLSEPIPLQKPIREIALPGPGSEILIDFGSAKIPVAEGSQPLVPPTCSGCFGSDFWLMRVDDGDRAFAHYANAFEHLDRWEGGTADRREVRDGWNVHSFGLSNTDTSVTIELFHARGSRSTCGSSPGTGPEPEG